MKLVKLYVVDVYVDYEGNQLATVSQLTDYHSTTPTRQPGTRLLDGRLDYTILAAFIGSKSACSTYAKKAEALWNGYTW